ncbi:MAG: hypothetical protein GC156_01510 [Actinomycetales bacterium]|nr:hypothetical protein [Actinomycetales bacterium]
MSVIDDHLAGFSGAQRSALQATVDVIRRSLPGAVEVLAYGMPTFKAGDEAGPAIIGLDGFRQHNSLFPYGNAVAQEFADELADYPQTKGSIHFGIDRAFPAPLLQRMLKVRMRLINEDYPKPNGEFREFFDNGFPKATGRMEDGVLTGSWRWYRRDGSLLRSGSFRLGEQRGTWTTYDRSGAPHKVTEYR